MQGAGDDLPRPRSVSPPRKPLPPPSVKGSALSARLERASAVRGATKVDDGPPPIPPPVTRARFSVKLGEATTGVADGGGDNKNGNGNGIESSASKEGPPAAAVTVDAAVVPEKGKGDETPLVVLPPAISEEKKVSIQEEGGGGRVDGRGRRGRGEGGDAGADRGFAGPRSLGGTTSSGIATAAGGSACGVGRSQIQASPQRWVPRRLTRLPRNMKKSVSTSPKASPRW